MPETFQKGQVWACYEFARRMIGNHNPNMIMDRTDWEIFRDDFRGKLGEVALKNYISSHVPGAIFNGDIDYTVTPRGQWDITDLIVNDTYINVKAIRGGSRFLLIETQRYNTDGTYCYHNNGGENVRIDAYALVKIDISEEMGPDDMNYRSIVEFWQSKGGRRITYTILGGIKHDDFWRIKHYAPRGILCNLQNLERICRNENAERATEEQLSNQAIRNRILQQNNYVLDSRNELQAIETLI